MSGEKQGEYRYSVTIKDSRSRTTSHEDANKHYGAGTSDFESNHTGFDIMMTVRFDAIAEEERIYNEDLPILKRIAIAIGAACEDVLEVKLPSGHKGEVQVRESKKAPEEATKQPEQAQGQQQLPDADEEPHYKKNPYPVMHGLLKAHALTKQEYAIYKKLEEQHGKSHTDIPDNELIAFLDDYYKAREAE